MIQHTNIRTMAGFLKTGGLGWLTNQIEAHGTDQYTLDQFSLRYPDLRSDVFNTAFQRALRDVNTAQRLQSGDPDFELGRGSHAVNPRISKEYYYVVHVSGEYVDQDGARQPLNLSFGANSETPLTRNDIMSAAQASLDNFLAKEDQYLTGNIDQSTLTMGIYRAERKS